MPVEAPRRIDNPVDLKPEPVVPRLSADLPTRVLERVNRKTYRRIGGRGRSPRCPHGKRLREARSCCQAGLSVETFFRNKLTFRQAA